VESVAGEHQLAFNKGPVNETNDWTLPEAYRRSRRGEINLPTHWAQRFDQVIVEELLEMNILASTA
jgi:hypothetical protein